MKHFFSILFLLLSVSLLAQNTYRLTWGREAALIGGGVTMWYAAKRAGPLNPPLSEAQVLGLDASHINSLDRFATRQNSARARRNSDLLLYTSPAWPTLLLLDPAVRRQAPTVGVMSAEAVLLTVGLTNLVKELGHRTRPYAYHPDVPLSDKINQDAQRSFFSGHTSVLAASTFVTAKIWTDCHPDSRWKPAVWASAAVLPAAMGCLRVRGGRHFPTDVLAGLVVGGAVGWLVPQLHKREK